MSYHFCLTHHTHRHTTNKWSWIHDRLPTGDMGVCECHSLYKAFHYLSCSDHSLLLIHVCARCQQHQHRIALGNSKAVQVRKHVGRTNLSLQIRILHTREKKISRGNEKQLLAMLIMTVKWHNTAIHANISLSRCGRYSLQ